MRTLQIMHPGLFTLLRMRARAAVRRYVRWIKRPAGILLTLLALGIVGLWFGPLLFWLIVGPPVDVAPVRTIGPLVLLIVCLMNVFSRGGAGISFTPAEVGHLYPAPVSRRDLVTYKLSTVVGSGLAFALFLSLLFMMFRKNLLLTLPAFVLLMLFINFLIVLIAVIRNVVMEMADTLTRKGLLIIIAAGAVAVFIGSLPIDLDRDVISNIQAVHESTLVQTLLAPFAVFVNLLLAESLVSYLMWFAIAAAMTAAVTLVLYSTDHVFLNVAAEIGRRKQRILEQAKKRGGMLVTGSGRWRMIALPRWAGIGPILRRQFNAILRSARSILFLMLGVAVFLGFFAWRISIDAAGDGSFAGIAVMGCLFSALFLAQSLRFDFRGDLDQMEWLKQLPIHPLPLAIGQVLAPTIVTTLIQWLLIVVLAVLLEPNPLLVAAFAAAVVPLNLFYYALENAFFLFAPTRGAGEGITNLKTFVRNILLGIVRVIIFGIAVAIAVAIGAGAYFIFGQSWIAFGVVGIVVLAIESALVLPFVAFMFTQYDVSVDTPA